MTALFGGTLHAEHVGHQPAGAIELAGIDAGVHAKVVARVRSAMITSSRAALPALSPIPLMVPSTWRAPLITPPERIGHRQPRSSWQCTLMVACSMFGTFSRMRDQRAVLLRHRVAGGVGYIDHRGAGGDDRVRASRTGSRIGAAGVFGVELHIVDKLRASFTASTAMASMVALLLRQRLAVRSSRNLPMMWMSEAPMPV
jgi:hypothetical protein